MGDVSVGKVELQNLELLLDRALKDAKTKASRAVESMNNRTANYQKDLWTAAEATEYATLIYSLTHSMEEEKVAFSPRKREFEDKTAILRESVESLGKVQSLRQPLDKSSVREGYRTLRQATDNLRNVYLSNTRPQASA